jgi:hypothetical protein
MDITTKNNTTCIEHMEQEKATNAKIDLEEDN